MAWPIKKLYGINVDPALIGSRQVPQNPASKAAAPPLQVWRYARNGRPVDVDLINKLLEAGNQAVLYRTKEVFHSSARIGADHAPASAGAGDRGRWMFHFHTGLYTHSLMAVLVMTPQSSGYTSNSAARIDIHNTSGVVVASSTFNYGANPGGTTTVDNIQFARVYQQYVDGVSPDTDYYGTVYDVDNGRTVSCSVFELQSMTENFSGYLPQNLNADSSILDVYREKLATLTYNLWRRGAATVFNWTVDAIASPRTTTGTTPVNLIDGTSTTYGAAIPGFTLDMTGKARLSQTTGVPVRMAVYMDSPVASGTVVNLRDSAGTSVMQVTYGGAGSAVGWYTTTGVLPASSAKYYLTFNSSGATTASVIAVSLIEYE